MRLFIFGFLFFCFFILVYLYMFLKMETEITVHAVTKDNLKPFKQITSAVLRSSYSVGWYKDCVKPRDWDYPADIHNILKDSADTHNISKGPADSHGPSQCTETHRFIGDTDLAVLAYFHAPPVAVLPRRNVLPKHTEWTEPVPSGAPCGVLRAVVDVPSTGAASVYIMTIAVLAPFRGRGAGSALLRHAVAEARFLGLEQVYLHVYAEDNGAVEWYKKRGFCVSAVVAGYYRKMRPPGDAYVMVMSV